jgi:hypothetical protein
MLDMQSKKSRDYNDYDHYAHDVEDIHFFASIETTIAQRWSRLAGQNGGLAKVDSGFDYAANLSLFACVA